MHDGVDNTVYNYEDSRQFVQIDVVVEGQERSQPSHSEGRDAVPQHQHEHPGAVEV